MALCQLECEFELCNNEFFSDKHQARYCSDPCRRSDQILKWAPEMFRLRQQGKTHRQVSEHLGISVEASRERYFRIPRYRDKYPDVDRVLTMVTNNQEA